jgi:hypothetical protein
MNRFFKVTMLSLALGVSPVALGCGGSVAAEQPSATAQSAVTKAPVAANAHGPIKMLGTALGEVPLRPEQRTEIEQLATDAETRHGNVVAARKDLMEALAAQVEAGTIDRTALQPKIDAAAKAWEAVRPADRAALERLHAILDASQRTAFVDALQAQLKAARGEHAGAKGAHLAEWATDLKLTDAQQEQIRGLLQAQFAAHKGEHAAAWKEGRAKGKQLFEAFKQDRFVMDEAMPAANLAERASTMSDKFIGVAQTVLPVLTPEQRTLAAQKLRTHAAQGALDEAAH